MGFSKFLCLLLSLSTRIISAAQVEVDIVNEAWEKLEKTQQDRFTLAAPFVDDSLRNPNWNFGRDAYMEVNRYVRLTADAQSQDGWLWSRSMVGYNNWAFEFGFNVQHEGALSGDGFAFWASTTKETTGPVFGNQDYFNGLGIFFDTYANSRVRHSYPWVMGMIGDSKTHYDHDFDGSNVEKGGCHLEFRNKPYASTARVAYMSGKFLRLDLKTSDAGKWMNCFEVNVSISAASYLGFSAMTGGVSSKHDITYVKGYSLKLTDSGRPYNPVNENSGSTASQNSGRTTSNNNRNGNNSQKKEGGWGFITYFFILVILGVVGYVGWVYYKTSQKNSYKRF